MMDEEMDGEPAEEKPPPPVKTLAERELLDRVTLIQCNQENNRVLMYHQPAAVMLRREILNAFADEVSQISTPANEKAILDEINKSADRLE